MISQSEDAVRDDGGPAFPTTIHGMTEFSGQPTIDTYEGMTLRDYFAGQALVGLLAAHAHPQSQGPSQATPEQHAKAAFELADSLLAARKS